MSNTNQEERLLAIVQAVCKNVKRSTIEEAILKEFSSFSDNTQFAIEAAIHGRTMYYHTLDYDFLKKIYTWLMLKHGSPIAGVTFEEFCNLLDFKP